MLRDTLYCITLYCSTGWESCMLSKLAMKNYRRNYFEFIKLKPFEKLIPELTYSYSFQEWILKADYLGITHPLNSHSWCNVNLGRRGKGVRFVWSTALKAASELSNKQEQSVTLKRHSKWSSLQIRSTVLLSVEKNNPAILLLSLKKSFKTSEMFLNIWYKEKFYNSSVLNIFTVVICKSC